MRGLVSGLISQWRSPSVGACVAHSLTPLSLPTHLNHNINQSNPRLVPGASVLDVGVGSGILAAMMGQWVSGSVGQLEGNEDGLVGLAGLQQPPLPPGITTTTHHPPPYQNPQGGWWPPPGTCTGSTSSRASWR